MTTSFSISEEDSSVALLVDAVRSRTALDPSSIKNRPELTPEAAYDIQDQVIAALGGKIEAAKLGLTSRAKQEQMNVNEPSYGWLMAGSRIEPSNPLKASDLIRPRAEPEIAFVIGKKLAGDAVTAAEVVAATEGVMPAIDILDSRYAGYLVHPSRGDRRQRFGGAIRVGQPSLAGRDQPENGWLCLHQERPVGRHRRRRRRS
ncbi:MAG: hypothetical protein ACR2NT_11750 [Acidimicrobiia bacterium]